MVEWEAMKEPRNQPISRYQVGKIMWHFCMDVTATQTALLTGINRNTVNRYYALFRQAIYAHRLKQFQRVVEEVERWMKATSEPADWFFIDTSGRALTSDALPLVPPDISKFNDGTVQVFDSKTGASAVFLQINSLVLKEQDHE